MMQIISTIIKKIWLIIFFLILLLLIPVATLWYGIEIDNLSMPRLKASGLYIKLHKKLIVRADEIDIDLPNFVEKRKDDSKKQFHELLQKLPWINRLFKTIDIKKINIDDNSMSLIYKDDIFYVDTNLLTVDARLSAKSETLKADISSLNFKDFNLSLNGIVTGDINKREIIFKGRFHTFNIQGDAYFFLKNNILSYAINSDDFSTLKPFVESLAQHVTLAPEAKEWMYKKIIGKKYNLEFLKGEVDIKNENYFLHEMQAKAKVSNATIKLKKDLPPIMANNINIQLKNNTLYFTIDKATYEDITLINQKAHIYNLLTRGNGIILNLDINALLNENIQRILQAYKLKIPVLQKSGKTHAKLFLDIRFVPYDIDVKGDFTIQDSHFLLSGAPFYTTYAKLNLDNRLLHVKNTNLSYKSLFNIQTDGLLDLHKENYTGDISLKTLHLQAGKDDLLNIQDIPTKVTVNIKKDDVHVNLPALGTNIHFKNNINTIDINKLSTFMPYSDFMKSLNIYEGALNIQTKDFNDFTIDANITDMKPLLSYKNTPVKSMGVSLKILGDTIKAYSKPTILTFFGDKKTTSINIQDANVLLETTNSKTSSKSTSAINVHGKNSNIILVDLNKTILLDKYTLSAAKQINAQAQYKKGQLHFTIDDQEIEATLKNLNDTFVNTLLDKKIFNGGNFSLKLNGKNMEDFWSHFNFKNTYLKSFASYNNILAFINSIPALLTFKKPGFNEKGYEVKNADILFSRKGDIITLHTIDIRGVDADIGGSGTINLNNKILDLNLMLKTFKDISNIIDKIPLLNYIFLGEDKSIQTAVKVKGTLDDPKVQTQAIKDVAFSPFDIIKRTLSLPFNLLGEGKSDK